MNLRMTMSCSAAIALATAIAGTASAQTNPPAPAPESAPPAEAAAPMAPPPAPTPATAPAPAATVLPNPPQSPLRIETPNGSSIRLGVLLQPQFQSVSNAALDGYSSNLFLRRARILAGGTLFGVVDYFFDTDYPNLFLAENVAGMAGAPNTSVKNTPGMNVQDAFITYHGFGDVVKVDAGYMLPPLAHNAVQGAGTLYAYDYFAYSFLSGNDFNSSGNPVGRDLGVELRGLLVGGHLEYRVGLFQGLRSGETATEVGANNFFRTTARVQVNLLDAEPGFFYAGTYLGAKKILSLGGSVDFQDSYKYFAGDAFLDLPVGPGLLTAQVNVAQWNGGTFIAALPKETAFMGEAGYLISGIELSPILRAEHLWVSNGAAPNQNRIGGGVAFWPFGHNTNLKAFYTNIKVDGAARSVNQFNVQWQLYFF